MIDIRVLRENPEAVRASQRARGADDGVVDEILRVDESRRAALAEFESLRAEQKAFGKQVAQAKGDEKQALLAQAKTMAARVKELEGQAAAGEATQTALLRQIGNLVEEGVPVGGEDDFVVLETSGEPRVVAEGETVRDHEEIGRLTGTIDIERGARAAGSRFYYLKGWGARLEQALMALCQEVAYREGFTPLVVPNLVRSETMAGAGFLDEHGDEVYYLPADDLYLSGTSEVGLAGFHADEILDLSDGPLRYCSTSTCYRREAGSAGRDTKGIFRVHQFQKTEMFVYCRQEDAAAEHRNLVRIEQGLIESLELPYRVIDVAAGDLGGPAARKFDIEAWFAAQGRYREVTSTSNCTTFQARRLGIRERTPEGPTRPVATLNGTMLTSTRPIIALLEHHQLPDGSVRVPAALAKHLGTDVIPLAE